MSAVLDPGAARGARAVAPLRIGGLFGPGVALFRSMRFAGKTLLVCLALLLPLLMLVGWQTWTRWESTMQERLDATRQHVEVAHSLIAWAAKQEEAGRWSRDEAQRQARAAVAALRYDDKEYFWINDMSPRMVMHPFKPELDGKDMAEFKDPNGLRLFMAMVDVVKRDGAGPVAYQWPKPGAAKPQDKISYVKGFSPWGWIVGSGVYIDDVQQALARRLAIIGAVVLGTLLLAGYLFASFFRAMDGGLKETSRHLHAITAGDLTTDPRVDGRDETADLMGDLRAMQQSLRRMVQGVRSSANEIVQSSGEIAQGAHELSTRTEQAASNLEQSASAMEQIRATVRSTGDHTEQASTIARDNAAAATEGGRVMREMTQTMQQIRDASARIGEIIGTIDGIAFQTNILSLNAAVEAARAGEEGRGFAVVAGEVRSLARHSAEAAQQIKALVNSSVDKVEAGRAVVGRAEQTIEAIVQSSKRVSELLDEIAVGAREQTQGIGEVGQAVQELDKMTQQNAAMVEQTAAASSTLNQLAGELSGQVERFKLD